jgi:hypothetical protein
MQQQASQRGYTKSPLRYVYETFDSGAEEIDQNRVDFQQLLPILKKIDPMYGTYEDFDVGEGNVNNRFVNREQELKNAYYADPSNFVSTRATPIATGINTFNEGNEDQKRIVDQINTGQLKIVPASYEVDVSDGGKELVNRYLVKDAQTGQTITTANPIDAEKGIFSIFADDRNSSGFFNNYVSTDPKGFVNPITSEEQSQYQSRPNSSANFYRNAALAALSMTGLAVPGLGEAIGAASGLGTVGGNVALNTGINAIKQAVTGNFDPLALATSAALSYGAGNLGADAVPGGNEFAGMTPADLASLDATGLINSGSFTGAYTTPVDNPVFGQPYDVSPLTGVPAGNEFAGMTPTDLANLDSTGIYTPSGNEFAGMTSQDLARLDSTGVYTPAGNEFAGMTSEDLARLDSTGIYTPAGNEFAGMTSEDLAKLDSTGTSGFGISPMQALRGLSAAKSLLGSGQEQAVAPATQFRGTRVPSGQVDYSGILSLLQMQSPQRRSLLG